MMPAPSASADWETRYRDNVLPVYRFVYSRVGNRPDAEDLTSKVFLRALPRMDYSPGKDGRAYLFATARTALADHWRERYKVNDVELPEEIAGLVTPAASDDAERTAGRILALLPNRYRQVLELRFLRGLSVHEAAGVMSISRGNAKVLQLRALRKAAELREGLIRTEASCRRYSG